ncbi:MAG: DUF2949 domain-containing protein [Spirulina sp.]
MLVNQETRFIKFLEEEIALPKEAISLAFRRSGGDIALLPIIFWQYGMADLTDLTLMFDWLESRYRSEFT